MGLFGKTKGKRFRSNRRALSPIFATLLMVAIVIIFGAVIYTYANNATTTASNDYVTSTTKNSEAISERIGFENIVYNSAGQGSLMVSVINSGTVNNLKIVSLFLYDSSRQPVGEFYYPVPALTTFSTPPVTFASGLGVSQEGYFNVNLKMSQPLQSGLYTVRLITERGSNFEYQFAVQST